MTAPENERPECRKRGMTGLMREASERLPGVESGSSSGLNGSAAHGAKQKLPTCLPGFR